MRRSALGACILGMTLVVSAGCSASPGRKPAASESGSAAGGAGGAAGRATPPPRPAPMPVVEVGGACELLTYEMIRERIAVEFEVAAAAEKGTTMTCVVQQRGGQYPDLTLSITPTTADQKYLGTALAPKGSTAVAGLGTAAYSMVTSAAGEAGPGCEVGWLSAKARLVILRYRLAPTGTPEEIAAVVPQLVELAKAVEPKVGQPPSSAASPAASTQPS